MFSRWFCILGCIGCRIDPIFENPSLHHSRRTFRFSSLFYTLHPLLTFTMLLHLSFLLFSFLFHTLLTPFYLLLLFVLFCWRRKKIIINTLTQKERKDLFFIIIHRKTKQKSPIHWNLSKSSNNFFDAIPSTKNNDYK